MTVGVVGGEIGGMAEVTGVDQDDLIVGNQVTKPILPCWSCG